MEAVAGIGILLLVGASLVVSARMLRLRLRGAGGPPELLLGLMLLLTVGIGYPAMIVALRLEPEAGRAVYGIATTCVVAGYAMLFLFTHHVFRSQETWARGLVALGIGALVASLVVQLRASANIQGVLSSAKMPGQSLLMTGTVIAAYGWTAWESLRYHGLMKRRLALGLVDPAVCNRFLLWGLLSVIVIAGIIVNVAAITMGVDPFGHPAVLLLSSVTGCSQAALLLLAFLPPRSYLDWIGQRSAGAAA